jgi:hypothetical protein
MDILAGLFLIAHGLVHAAYLSPKPGDPKYPFNFDKSWFYGVAKTKSEPIGNILVVFSVLFLCLSGLGVLGVPGLVDLSQTLILIGSMLSALVLVLFWHKWLFMGLIIDIFFIIGVICFNWFS